MQRRFGKLFLGVSMLATGALAGGCSDDLPLPSSGGAADDVQPSTVTVDIHTADSPTIYGSCEMGPVVVRFEVQRGPETPPEVRASDPTTGPNEIDARFLSSNGQPFMTRIGGHTYINPQWDVDEQELFPQPDVGSRNADFELAAACAKAVMTHSIPLGYEHEREALVELGAAATAHPWASNGPTSVAPGSEPGIGQSSSALMSDGYVHWFGLYVKPFVWKTVLGVQLGAGQHSSTWSTSTSPGGVTYSTRITCNHGTCANSSVMTQSCYRVFYNRSVALPSMGTCGITQANEGFVSGCCPTDYKVTPTEVGHLCHHDTMVQRETMANYPQVPNYANYCVNWAKWYWAPGCY